VYEGYFLALQRPFLNPDFGNPFLLAQMMGGREGGPSPSQKTLMEYVCALLSFCKEVILRDHQHDYLSFNAFQWKSRKFPLFGLSKEQ
jgi:hypothetical protein